MSTSTSYTNLSLFGSRIHAAKTLPVITEAFNIARAALEQFANGDENRTLILAKIAEMEKAKEEELYIHPLRLAAASLKSAPDSARINCHGYANKALGAIVNTLSKRMAETYWAGLSQSECEKEILDIARIVEAHKATIPVSIK